MLKIAISGNIASGKTTVGKIITEQGYKVFDTDLISHEILEKASEDIKKIFKGYDITNSGELDRKKIAKLIFSNNILKKELENYIHPKIKNELLDIFKKNENTETVIFVMVPLLFETGFDKLFDKILFIYTEENIQLERLKNRDSLTKEQALKRINAQEKTETKIIKSDYVIENNSNLEILKEKTLEFLSNIC